MDNKNVKTSANQTAPEKKQRKKLMMGMLVLLASGVLLVGSLFAFFSDTLTGNSKADAGTLDIQDVNGKGDSDTYKGYTVSRYNPTTSNWAEFDGEADILNPGDILRIDAGIKNVGSKSAWLRSELKFDFANTGSSLGMMDNIDLYLPSETVTTSNGIGTISGSAIKDGTNDEMVLVDISEFTKSYNITLGALSGTIEHETATADALVGEVVEADKVLYTQPVLYVVFKGTAPNAAQGLPMNISVTWKAIQYRNNAAAKPTDWSGVESITLP